jgi:hypothetical protein
VVPSPAAATGDGSQEKLARLGFELDDAVVGVLAGLPGWLLAGAQLVKECGRRRSRQVRRPIAASSDDGSHVQAAREVARALRG